MLIEDKNLKDSISPLPNLPLIKGEDRGGGLSYTKTDKLVTAVYMVTDIMDKDEPIKNKLRTLGVEILSNIHLISQSHKDYVATNLLALIGEVMSFLDIALAINIISDMNFSILKKEFIQLHQSIQGSVYNIEKPKVEINLSEFLKDSSLERWQSRGGKSIHLPHSSGYSSRGEFNSTRIGVQKGSTLMKALSDKTNNLSNRNISLQKNITDFDFLKKERRFKIIKIIKNRPEGASIKDIKLSINQDHEGGVLYSEKTIQRELLSMIKDGVLYKTGEKRWSVYFIKN